MTDKTMKEEEGVFIDRITDLMVETGQEVKHFAYGKKETKKTHKYE